MGHVRSGATRTGAGKGYWRSESLLVSVSPVFDRVWSRRRGYNQQQCR